ncbi:3-oxoacyl-[acyl-carrier-protein] reductase FabG-like [Galleria mellonella]|uniref:3-oxoacyl-[acyl-carrier-protein] reductase FabG-like n=1 Tax=Galleria mellonella TaxID=7137 RepID=A0A6J1WIH8_GALME|nr:3-oxoacyl-[acyl-carrier-protein] reductase FabG-like [Galleria mellonella]
MSFSGKVVLITGASSGIGAVTAIQYAKEEADVVIVGRNEAKLNDVIEKCKHVGKAPFVIKADVSIDEDARRIINETINKFGKLDVLINNAGFTKYGSILDGTVVDAYDKIMGTNVRAVIQLTTLATPHLIKSKGNIVNVSSVAGFAVRLVQQNAYSLSKAAVNHFTKGAALELASYGVRVNAVSPGPVRTDFLENAGIKDTWDNFRNGVALRRISEPEEIADVILYLSSDKARGITGSNFLADNGRLLL